MTIAGLVSKFTLKANGDCEIIVNNEILPFLVLYGGGYGNGITKYFYDVMQQLTSKYSMRLYGILCSMESREFPYKTFDVDELRRILGFPESEPDKKVFQTLKKIKDELGDKADVWPRDVVSVGTQTDFDIMYRGKLFTHVSIHVPGIHNVKNALAASAAAICLGCGPLAVRYGLGAFNGAGRRFEFKGKYNGADVYDDYAHHPGELKALLDTVETLGYKRTIVVFQPHTYSRTKALFDDFVAQLRRPDIAILAEIYAAREQNTIGISSKDISDRIENSMYFDSFDEILKTLRWTAAPGDIILTVGAGDIYKVGERLVSE